MLVLDGDLLLTVVCTAVGVVASWWFTRRHYTAAVPHFGELTPEDVEIAKTAPLPISAFAAMGDYGALIVTSCRCRWDLARYCHRCNRFTNSSRPVRSKAAGAGPSPSLSAFPYFASRGVVSPRRGAPLPPRFPYGPLALQ